MKKLTHLLFALFIIIYSYSQAKTNQTLLVNVPDNNFECYLETHNINGEEVDITSSNNMGNGIVPILQINNVSKLDLSNLEVNTVQGIEHFHLLTQLNVSNNKLNTIDISKNINLDWIDCSNNNINQLDISNNVDLDWIHCNHNNLTDLDVLKNDGLD